MQISVRPTLEDYQALAEIQARKAVLGGYSACFTTALQFAAHHPPLSWEPLRKMKFEPLVEAEPGPQVLSITVEPVLYICVKSRFEQQYTGRVQASFIFRMVLAHYRQWLREGKEEDFAKVDGIELIQHICQLLTSNDARARTALEEINKIVKTWQEVPEYAD